MSPASAGSDMALIRAVPGRRTSRLNRRIDHAMRLLDIARASLQLDRPATEIADRLCYLGYTAPDVAPLLPRGRPGPVSR